MSFRDLIQDVSRTLWAHRVRTMLTMFGIAWGVVSIVLMTAAGEGLRVGQAKQAETLGRDLMIVFHGRTSLQAGGTRAGRLVHWVDSDIAHLQSEAADCQYTIPELEQNDVRSHTAYNAAAFTVTGSMPEFSEIRSLGVSEGRFYNSDDIKEGRRVAFLGSDAKKQLFGGRPSVGQFVYLNDIPFTVVGVMSSKKQDSSYDGWDVNKIFIPYSAMRREFPDKPPGTPETFDQLLVVPRSVEQHESCKAQVRHVLARLHNYEPDAIGLADFGKPGNYFARQVDRWTKQYRASETQHIPEVERLIEWLPRTLPEQKRVSVVHGDYRLDNMIFHPTEPRVKAVLDWELSTLGDPMADFTYLLMQWTMPGLAGADLKALNIPSMDEAARIYCNIAGTEVPDLNWYFSYNLFRLAGITQGIAGRIRDGTAANAKAMESAKRTVPLAKASWDYAQKAGAV